MLNGNLLKAGDSVFPLPIGIPVVLEYDNSGKLISATIDSDGRSVYSEIIKYTDVPARILTNNGYAVIEGILYSGLPYSESLGQIPSGQLDSMVSDLQSGQPFEFCAGIANVTSINLKTLSQVRTWLQSNKFNILPNFIIPLGDLEKACDRALTATNLSKQDLMGFYIYRGKDLIKYYINLKYDKVENISVYLDPSGYVHAQLETSLENTINTSYHEVASKCIFTGDTIVLNESNKIEYNETWLTRRDDPDTSYTCPLCGRKYFIKDEFERCPNPHCYSTMYEDLKHFTNSLNLPELPYEEYVEAVNNSVITKFSDILLLPQYRDYEIEVAVPDLLDAIIPIPDVRNRESIWELYSRCNGSWDSITHYLLYPQDIAGDLGIIDTQLSTWLLDKVNANSILDVFQYSNIKLVAQTKKFNGSPIFRKTPIALTGKFRHGSYKEIESILLSYDATVSTLDKADICIIGDIKEDINGVEVNRLRQRGGYVYDECEFFKKFQIDEDLAQMVR